MRTWVRTGSREGTWKLGAGNVGNSPVPGSCSGSCFVIRQTDWEELVVDLGVVKKLELLQKGCAKGW